MVVSTQPRARVASESPHRCSRHPSRSLRDLRPGSLDMKAWLKRHEFDWWIGFAVGFPVIFLFCGLLFLALVGLEAAL